jgi:hypothetical protein
MSGQLYRWHWRAWLPERHGQLFRLVATAAKGSRAEPPAFPIPLAVLADEPLKPMRNARLIEFLSDGRRYTTSGNALRKA